MSEPNIPPGMEPAFPFQCQGPTTAPEIYYGMTLRDWFAGMALQGMCANPDITAAMSNEGMKPKEVRYSFADSAYKQADAMIAEREKQP